MFWILTYQIYGFKIFFSNSEGCIFIGGLFLLLCIVILKTNSLTPIGVVRAPTKYSVNRIVINK